LQGKLHPKPRFRKRKALGKLYDKGKDKQVFLEGESWGVKED